MSLLKRNAFIAAGIALYALNAIFPISSIAESIALNTKEPHPAVAAAQEQGSNTLQYLMLDDANTSTGNSSSLDESIFEPLQLPGITNLDSDIESYVVKGPKGNQYSIRVQRDAESGHASIFINQQQVMKFRSGYDVLDAYDRAHLVAQRLYSHITDALTTGPKPKAMSIQPQAAEDGHYVLKIDDDVLVTIDADVADANGNSEKAQALVWTNQIRNALGMKPYHEPLVTSLASIIASPGLSKKFKLPLSTAYFKGTGKTQSGMASWYGPGFHGRRSSDGSRFDMNQMTAAHRYLPFGTVLRVKNNRNGKQCLVQVTDRGPFAHGRILDLSKAAAGSIGMLGSGTASITIEVLEPGKNSVQPVVAQKDPSLIGVISDNGDKSN